MSDVNIISVGIQGPPGPAGHGHTYVHVQDVPLETWTINHNLRKRPAITLVDENERPFYTDVHYQDDNTVLVYFDTPSTGKVYLN